MYRPDKLSHNSEDKSAKYVVTGDDFFNSFRGKQQHVLQELREEGKDK